MSLCYVNIYHKNFLFGRLFKVVLYSEATRCFVDHALCVLPSDLPGVCRGALEPCECAPAAGQAARGPAALQGGDPHLTDLCRRVLEHGQHAEGDAGREGRPAVLHARHPDQPRLRRRPQQPRLHPQGFGQHPRGHRLVQDGAEAQAGLPRRLLQSRTLSAGKSRLWCV